MKFLIAVGAALAVLVVPGSALAWNGGKVVSVSCPEIHVNLPVENGNWQVWAVEKGKVVYGPVLVPGFAGDQVVGGFWTPDDATHTGTVYAANAANASDGKVSLPYQLTRCSQPTGAQGPPGPPGQPGAPGIGYDCTGAAVPTGGVPALCPGSSGPPGPPAKTCKSTRVYRVKVAARFRGAPITSARLTWDNGQRHTRAVRRSDGRLHAVVSFRGVTSPLRGLWTITMRIGFDGGKHATLTRNLRICAPSDGNLNFATDVHRDGS